MTSANTPQGHTKSPTGKARRLDDRRHPNAIQKFNIKEWWWTPLRSAAYAGIGILFAAMTILMIATFPWDDSTVGEKRGMLFFMLPWSFVCHDLFAILFFVLAIRALANPHTLILEGKGGLILRSLVRANFIAVESINTVELVGQMREDKTLWSQCIVTTFSAGTLSLPPFAARETFLKAMKAAHPAVAVTYA